MSISVFTQNADGSYTQIVNTYYSEATFTFPGNQYGISVTHDWQFERWWGSGEDSTDEGNSDFGGVANDQVFQLNQTITLYGGGWRRNGYYFKIYNLRTASTTITYNGNGSDGGSTNSNTALYNYNFTFQTNGFTKTGYAFDKWALSSNGNFIGYYYSGQLYGAWTLTSRDAIALAIWTAKKYTITYDANGGSGTLATNPQTATYDSTFTFSANGFTRTGYAFSGWWLYESNGITRINSTSTYASGQLYGTWNIDRDVIAKAQWTPKEYTITYDGNISSGSMPPSKATYGSPFTFSANTFAKQGYAFSGWWLYESNGITRINSTSTYASGQLYGTWNIDRDVIAKAQWNTNSYTVTFDRNGKGTGKTVTQSVGTTVTCPTLKAVGYVFGGWAISATSTTVNKEGNATFVLGAANQTFFAIWTENTNGSVSFSELQTVYGGINPIGISEYRTESGQTTANSQITLSANFKGKGPAP
jgi:hypothetical protein